MAKPDGPKGKIAWARAERLDEVTSGLRTKLGGGQQIGARKAGEDEGAGLRRVGGNPRRLEDDLHSGLRRGVGVDHIHAIQAQLRGGDVETLPGLLQGLDEIGR